MEAGHQGAGFNILTLFLLLLIVGGVAFFLIRRGRRNEKASGKISGFRKSNDGKGNE